MVVTVLLIHSLDGDIDQVDELDGPEEVGYDAVIIVGGGLLGFGALDPAPVGVPIDPMVLFPKRDRVVSIVAAEVDVHLYFFPGR